MADRVEIQMPSGEWEERSSQNISEVELGYPMRCCWKNKEGKPCHTPMVSARRTKPYPHIIFRQKNSESIHILGCEYDKRRKSETVSHTDSRASDSTVEDIWKGMSKITRHDRGKGKMRGSLGEESGEGGASGGAEPNPRPVRRKSRRPTTPESLTRLLMDLSVDNPYANTHVRDLIVDHRTVDSFRANGIPQNTYVLVLAKRLAPANRTFTPNDGEIILVDCKYNASREAVPNGCMQFRLRLSGKAKADMYKYLMHKEDNTYIIIFCCWKKDHDNANTYIAMDVDEDHIGIITLMGR